MRSRKRRCVLLGDYELRVTSPTEVTLPAATEELVAGTKEIALKKDTPVPVSGWVFRAPRSLQVDLVSS